MNRVEVIGERIGHMLVRRLIKRLKAVLAENDKLQGELRMRCEAHEALTKTLGNMRLRFLADAAERERALRQLALAERGRERAVERRTQAEAEIDALRARVKELEAQPKAPGVWIRKAAPAPTAAAPRVQSPIEAATEEARVGVTNAAPRPR